MIKKILALLIIVSLMTSGFVIGVVANESEESDLILIFEENFDDYEKDIKVTSTMMPNFFNCSANSIGDGSITVQEDSASNLYLKSHVFTQVYSEIPIVGDYEFSMDILQAEGSVSAAVLIRAAKLTIPYYETDGRPNNSVCQSGLLLYPHATGIDINIKTYNEEIEKAGKHDNNITKFTFSEGTSYGIEKPMPLRVTDDGEKISIFVNNELICYVVVSEPNQYYELHKTNDACFGKAVLYNADGTEIATYIDPVMGSDNSYIGWVTRSSLMSIDNVRVFASKSYQALLAINKIPTKINDQNLDEAKEAVGEARAFYDALSDEEKALVSNSDLLIQAENTINSYENATETPTAPVTDPVTEPITEPETDPVENHTEEATTESGEVPTNPTTEPITDSFTSSVTESASDNSDQEIESGDNTEVKIIDDSLAVWVILAIMIVVVCTAASVIIIKVRK